MSGAAPRLAGPTARAARAAGRGGRRRRTKSARVLGCAEPSEEVQVNTASPSLVDASTQVTIVICFAILASIPFYVAVAWMVAGQRADASGGGLPAVLVWALAAVGIALLAAAQAMWAAMKRGAAARPTPAERLSSYRTAAIVSFAMRESAAIIGLVISLLTGDLRWCLALSAAAVLAMLLGFPRRADMVRLAGDPAAAPIG